MSYSYLMENIEEAARLEIKTDPDAVRVQARWCGLKPGIRVLDAGCGPGMVTAILHDMIQPEGSILGLDYSEERILHARENYGEKIGIDFRVHDLRTPLKEREEFDLIWVRFVLEYNLAGSLDIVGNLIDCLKPGGRLCLLDLDHNCLSHYELTKPMETILFELMDRLEKAYDFDPYAGRKLYAYQYDRGYEDIEVEMLPHHLFYGDMRDEDMFNWLKKVEVVSTREKALFKGYPGGREAFLGDFKRFFLDPRRFTYTPLILCKGIKPFK